jgi:hypothetical protein
MATFVNENFTGTDSTTVQANDADWTKHGSATGDALISSNRARSNGSVQALYYHAGTPASADYYVEGVIRRDSGVTSTEQGAVCGRIDTAANNRYDVVRVESGSFLLRKTIAGVDTTLDTYALALATPEEYTIKLEMIGDQIKGYIDGVEQLSATDSSITAAGKAGFFLFRGSSTGGYHIDSITAADAAGLPPTNTVAPAITGTTETGETLTCSTGTWTGDPTITYAYLWKRGGTPIGGATTSTYLLDVLDEAENILCTVTATNGSGSVSEDSNTVVPTAPSGGVTGQMKAAVGGVWEDAPVKVAASGVWA